MYIHIPLDVSCDSLWLTVNNGKTFRADQVSHGVAIVVDGTLRCSLSLLPKALPDSPMYSSGQFICGHLNL